MRTLVSATKQQTAGGHSRKPLVPNMRSAVGLQRTLGNEAMQQLIESEIRAPGKSVAPSVYSGRTGAAVAGAVSPVPGVLQAKLAVGSVNDPLEREADRVADQVMRMPDPLPVSRGALLQISRKCACEGSGEPCASCSAEQDDALKRQATGAVASTEAPPIVHEVLASPGRPLDAATRAFFEPRFGHDFSRVRVHSGAAAARSANAVNALAYTVGHDIVLGDGGATPHLLAHELAHVIQQNAATEAVAPGVQRVRRQSDPIQAASAIFGIDSSTLGSTGLEQHDDAQPTARGDMDLSCYYRLDCPISVPCEGKTACGIASCGTGSCRSDSCPPGFKNVIFKAWCQYDCNPSGAAFLFITNFGGFKIGPFCID